MVFMSSGGSLTLEDLQWFRSCPLSLLVLEGPRCSEPADRESTAHACHHRFRAPETKNKEGVGRGLVVEAASSYRG